ncbi:hypothetical protein SAICODRAFT_193017 [Saitoella complicata NRRL Y-17804]|uniref:uncharacterized protein n=1 Tax=Saitoella complicata (strain BCRC 22490 / CBS 7301 / JCM 7358 / NBRC 10748 / NRRL Y-17804) TaxID=698492 RepID=UPI000866D2B9|nr:uncharacterized protein SAICODRAFT_193017 [Saitoella complicata NRRL Y-17804]ODQ49723.1 hypothetical protein SAICODRAFT_193017 [Saitoella complicata NRRL Y-17804]
MLPDLTVAARVEDCGSSTGNGTKLLPVDGTGISISLSVEICAVAQLRIPGIATVCRGIEPHMRDLHSSRYISSRHLYGFPNPSQLVLWFEILINHVVFAGIIQGLRQSLD